MPLDSLIRVKSVIAYQWSAPFVFSVLPLSEPMLTFFTDPLLPPVPLAVFAHGAIAVDGAIGFIDHFNTL